MSYSHNGLGHNTPSRQGYTRRTLLPNHRFPNVRNVEEACVAIANTYPSNFWKYGHTAEGYHKTLLQYGFEYRNGRELTQHSVACTLTNLVDKGLMAVLHYKWGRRGQQDARQCAPPDQARRMSEEDHKLAEMFQKLNVGPWRAMSVYHQRELYSPRRRFTQFRRTA